MLTTGRSRRNQLALLVRCSQLLFKADSLPLHRSFLYALHVAAQWPDSRNGVLVVVDADGFSSAIRQSPRSTLEAPAIPARADLLLREREGEFLAEMALSGGAGLQPASGRLPARY